MCVYECWFVHVAGCNAERAGKGIRYPEAGVTRGCGPPTKVIETGLPSSVRAVHTLNHWAFSLVPGLPISHACLCVSYSTLLSLECRMKAGTMPFLLFHSGMESFSQAVKFLAPRCSYSEKHFSFLHMCLTIWAWHREYHNTENSTHNCFLTLQRWP